MSSRKRQKHDNGAQQMEELEDDSYSDEEDESMDHNDEESTESIKRPGRPRKTSSSIVDCHSMDVPRRRGRGPSKRPCLNRNALMARENRQRKKEYIELMEHKLQNYQQEHAELNSTIQRQNQEIKRLNNEVVYLKTVLNNNTLITSLLKAMNNSLSNMHGTSAPTLSSTKVTPAKQTDVLNWVISGQTNSPGKNITSMSLSETSSKQSLEANLKEDSQRMNIGPIAKGKIARKSMPLHNNTTAVRIKDSSSVKNYLGGDNMNLPQKSSPESSDYCEYNMGKSSSGNISQLPATPMSAVSNSMDKGDASLSDTDFSQLSSFNVDFLDTFNKFDDMANPLQFEQDTPNFEETLFHTLDKDTGISSNDIIDSLDFGKLSDASNEKTLFNSLENTGVCLHINSARVSLEYCSICHANSLKSLNSESFV